MYVVITTTITITTNIYLYSLCKAFFLRFFNILVPLIFTKTMSQVKSGNDITKSRRCVVTCLHIWSYSLYREDRYPTHNIRCNASRNFQTAFSFVLINKLLACLHILCLFINSRSTNIQKIYIARSMQHIHKLWVNDYVIVYWISMRYGLLFFNMDCKRSMAVWNKGIFGN